jgi:hypothetical protein
MTSEKKSYPGEKSCPRVRGRREFLHFSPHPHRDFFGLLSQGVEKKRLGGFAEMKSRFMMTHRLGFQKVNDDALPGEIEY